MKRFRITPRASADIDEIWTYIAQDNPSAADRVEQQLHDAMRLLAEFPGIGHVRADVDDPRYRFWSVFSYVIVYRPDPKPVEVIRVIHGSRDIGSLMQ
jgi:plasmid stabilization system protein ParE